MTRTTAAAPSFKLGELFTEEEIDRARAVYARAKATNTQPHAELAALVKEHSLERINTTTGQQNDPSYLAYMLEYVFDQHDN